MGDNGENTSKNAQSGREPSKSNTAAFQGAQVAEKSRIQKMLRFLSPTDDLDCKVTKVKQNILLEPPSQDPTGFQLTDVADIIHGFHQLTSY